MREPHTGPSGQAGQGMGLRLSMAWGWRGALGLVLMHPHWKSGQGWGLKIK